MSVCVTGERYYTLGCWARLRVHARQVCVCTCVTGEQYFTIAAERPCVCVCVCVWVRACVPAASTQAGVDVASQDHTASPTSDP